MIYSWIKAWNQGLVKGAKLCFRYPYFYFRHGESTSTASQQTYTASQLSKEINKVPLLLQNLDTDSWTSRVAFIAESLLTSKFDYGNSNSQYKEMLPKSSHWWFWSCCEYLMTVLI